MISIGCLNKHPNKLQYIGSLQNMTIIDFILFIFKITLTYFSLCIYNKQNYMNPEKASKSVGKRKSKYNIHAQSFIQQLRQEQFNNRYTLTDKKQQYDALNDPYTSYYFSNNSVKMHLKTFRKAIKQQCNQQQKKRISQLISKRITEKFKDVISPKTVVYEHQMTPLQIGSLIKKSTSSLLNKKSRKSFASFSSNEDTNIKVSKSKKRYFPPVRQQICQSINSGTQYTSLQLDNHKEHKSVEKTKIISIKKDKLIKCIDELDTLTQKQTKNMKSVDLNSKTHTEQNLQKQLIMKSTLRDIEQKAQQRAYANKLAEQLHRKKHEKWMMFLSQKKQLLSQLVSNPPQKEKHL